MAITTKAITISVAPILTKIFACKIPTPRCINLKTAPTITSNAPRIISNLGIRIDIIYIVERKWF